MCCKTIKTDQYQASTNRNIQNDTSHNEKPNLAGLWRIGGIEVYSLQRIFAIPAECHRHVWLALADWFHYGDPFLGLVDSENRWLALAL